MRFFIVFLVSALSFGHYAVIIEPLETLDLSGMTSELRADEAERQLSRVFRRIDSKRS